MESRRINKRQGVLAVAIALLAMVACAHVAVAGMNFVAGARSETRSPNVARGDKSLYDKTKKINPSMETFNSDNELMDGTDDVWAIVFTGLSVVALFVVIGFLYSLKP
mmetsp:Transcript_44546/g.105569  ORF Transcript_44546/g.105569 Transcript_44546/m.105569 type:complete len:108 (+) Transcript_44546:84-407(+)